MLARPADYRINRTVIGRSRSAHARSAVSTSAGTLRTVSARQHRSPRDSARPPGSERNAPASSASVRVQRFDRDAGGAEQLAQAGDVDARRQPACRQPPPDSPPRGRRRRSPRRPGRCRGSSWISASTADASRTVIRWQQRVGARRATPRRTSATPVPAGQPAQFRDRVLLTLQHEPRPGQVQVQPIAGNQSQRLPGPPPGSPGDLADPSPLWHPQTSVPRRVRLWHVDCKAPGPDEGAGSISLTLRTAPPARAPGRPGTGW